MQSMHIKRCGIGMRSQRAMRKLHSKVEERTVSVDETIVAWYNLAHLHASSQGARLPAAADAFGRPARGLSHGNPLLTGRSRIPGGTILEGR